MGVAFARFSAYLFPWMSEGNILADMGLFDISAAQLSAIILIAPTCRDLARIDAWAPCTLGLIAGGAGGNLVSLLTSPAGVTRYGWSASP